MGNCCKRDGIMSYFCDCDIYMDQFIDWNKVDENVPELSFNGMRRHCKVVSVYDGDTIKVVFPLNGKMYKWNCRINGVDTPEIRTRCLPEKKHGYLVRDKLREKILDKVVYILCGDFDKYGRLLVNVYINGTDISKWLIEKNYAFEYHGKTKISWKDYFEKKEQGDDVGEGDGAGNGRGKDEKAVSVYDISSEIIV